MIFDWGGPPAGTVRDWLDARAKGDGVAIVFPETDEVLGWRALRDEARTMAQGLVGLNIQPGESVAIVHPNGREGVVALYAVLYGGFRATMINLAAGPDAISYALDHCGARYAFVHHSQLDTIGAIAPQRMSIVSPEMLSLRLEIPSFDATQTCFADVHVGYNWPAKRRGAHARKPFGWGVDHSDCTRFVPGGSGALRSAHLPYQWLMCDRYGCARVGWITRDDSKVFGLEVLATG